MIVTEYDDAEVREAREAGALEYVTKDNLLEIRKVLLGKKRSAAQIQPK